MTKDEALKLALEALEEATTYTSSPSWSPSMTEECNKAITAPPCAKQPAQQEPVAYWIPKAEQFCIADPSGRPFAKAWKPLYTTPPQHSCKFPLCQNEAYQQALAEQITQELYTGTPQRTWVGLTEEEFQWIYDHGRTPAGMMELVEARLKEKNHDKD